MTRTNFEDRLNALLREQHDATPGLEQRIRANLPARDPLQGLIDRIASNFARTALTAAIPLAIGFAVGYDPNYAADEFDTEMVVIAFVENFEELESE